MDRVKRIATEEAWVNRATVDAWQALLARKDAPDEPWVPYVRAFWSRSERIAMADLLLDVGAGRLARMDELGIDMQILSITAPGVQVFDPVEGAELAAASNDELAATCRAYPDRFAGLAAIAPHNAEASAAEIERAMTTLGLNGVILNSHTHGHYLDEPQFEPVLAALAQYDAPLYLHPTMLPSSWGAPYLWRGFNNTLAAFSHDVWLHVLALIFSGAFDRYPNLKLVIGHAGEAMPLLLYRFDWMQKHADGKEGLRGGAPAVTLQHKVSYYFRHNIWVTTSGVAWAPAIKYCIDVLGADRVLYAMDYPFQNSAEEVRVYDDLDVSHDIRASLMQANAERLFKLGAPVPSAEPR
jgi:predicted TIM-barrel fold metal-dependent hydrolase